MTESTRLLKSTPQDRINNRRRGNYPLIDPWEYAGSPREARQAVVASGIFHACWGQITTVANTRNFTIDLDGFSYLRKWRGSSSGKKKKGNSVHCELSPHDSQGVHRPVGRSWRIYSFVVIRTVISQSTQRLLLFAFRRGFIYDLIGEVKRPR